MKLHRTLVQAVIDTLQQIFIGCVYADKAVEQVLKQNSRWGSRDRRFIAETTYEMVRWWRLISRSAAIEEPRQSSEFWKIFAAWQIMNEVELPDWEEFRGIDKAEILSVAIAAKQIRKYRESIPDWLDELGCVELGETVWTNELAALNKEAKVVLRVNTLKTNRIQLQRLLDQESVETTIIGDYHDALMLNKRQSLQQLSEFKQGFFEIQDASSQMIAPFLDVKEGMSVIDACAGAGGKSLHIAAMMNNSGRIFSMDVEERKLSELKKRADRGGVTVVKTKMITDEEVKKLKDSADRLLLDVPCSGLGVIRRNPDAKWKLSLDFINETKRMQQQIISNYSQMLKPGGIMVYATCSILPSENQRQVELFLENNSNFEFIEDRKVLPSEGFDGFYMAKLKRLN
ncbi:MAG: RsmB/NOP family class I SAM-dependent RNA methyltransferase [Bacteroidetes bacterium]|nr:RsmB/NOP family class I SAM-dependent RNA methyltransferase [Bacteroidota bacterium]